MATLKRDDGVQFIIRPYRELFSPGRTSVLKHKIRNLAHKQGLNVRVFKLDDGRLEAAYSHEPGFLLGETVWIYLNKPANLIYCEALADERRQALLVVVRNGAVFSDAKVPFANLIEEFQSLSINNDKYDIYVYGDVPLGETEEGGKYAFDAKYVNSFTKLDEPLLAKLMIYEEAQLQPLELALKSPCLGKSKIPRIILASIFIIIIIIAWHVYKNIPEEISPEMRLPVAAPIIQPYEGYYKALETPAPQDQIVNIILITQIAHNFPGWKLNSVSYDGINYALQFSLEGGSIIQAQDWARKNNIDLEMQGDNITLTIPSQLKNRSQFKSIYPIEQVIGLLVDDINRVLAGKNVTFSDITTNENYKEANVTINFSSTYPGMLVLVGAELSKLPVTITAINLTVDKNLFTGSFTLKVLGD
jgi:hypothetical protein